MTARKPPSDIGDRVKRMVHEEAARTMARRRAAGRARLLRPVRWLTRHLRRGADEGGVR